MAVLSIENLSKTYRRGFWGRPHIALCDLSLTVEEGEIFGFLGANGAGKTTTFKILMGLASATSGKANILGADSTSSGVRQHVGFLPEEAYFYSYLTAAELLFFYGRLQGMTRRDIAARIDEILESVGLTHARDTRLGEYSKGMRQRFGIAQAIVNDPKVLFLDEPLSGLDPLGRKGLKDLILALRDQGKTVFFSSHILSDAEAICDRIAIIHQGRLKAQGRLTDLLGSKVQSCEIRVSGIDVETATALGAGVASVTADGTMVMITLGADEDPDRWVGLLREKGARIEALIPFRESLEDYFVRTWGTEGDAGQGGA